MQGLANLIQNENLVGGFYIGLFGRVCRYLKEVCTLFLADSCCCK